MLTTAHPNADLAARFRCIILGLCAVVASFIATDFTAGPLVGATYMRLRRLSLRFDAIVRRLGAGVRRPARCPAACCARAPRGRAPGLLPRHRGWLAGLLRGEAASFGGYDGRLGYLLRDPAMVALLAASPELGRVLRPLWRMLSTDKLPAVLRLAPRAPEPALACADPGGAALGGAPVCALPELPHAGRVELDASPPSGSASAISA